MSIFKIMDLNVKIIEGVQQFSVLYDNCSDLDERNHAWMQLAEKLDMHVQTLQIRWHALLQLYQRDDNFKYAKRMQFIHRNEERKIKSDNWPEFVITDEYLKYYSNEDQEQFIYLETKEENNSQSLRAAKENDSNYTEETQNKDLKNREDDSSAADKLAVKGNRISEQSQPQDDDIKMKSKRKSKETDIGNNEALKEKEELPPVDRNKTKNTLFDASKEKQLVGERCEDIIFGELVSAMLKGMNENKKKNIKKEIMNILFS